MTIDLINTDEYIVDNSPKKTKFEVGEQVYVDNKPCKIIFGAFDKGFHSFYEIEDENNQVYAVNSKDIKKQQK